MRVLPAHGSLRQGRPTVGVMDQQDEAREFLASRRARLTPAAVGLPPSIGRRRVPGLRRDEVAALAGLSSEYYAHLERGNLARASDAALDALAASGARWGGYPTTWFAELLRAGYRGKPRQREIEASADPNTHPSVVAHRRLVATVKGLLS